MSHAGARSRIHSIRMVVVLVAMSMTVTWTAGIAGTAAADTPTTTTFTAVADAFVSTAFPDQNFGTSTELRMSNPQRSSYVKFDLTGLSGAVTGAILTFSSPAASTLGFDVRGVADSTWGEATITQNSAPPMNAAVAASTGAFAAGAVSLDVTSLVTGPGQVSFGLTRTSTNLFAVSSRETGAATAPTLVVTTDTGGGGGGGGGTPTTTPFTAAADAFVTTGFPDTNFGSSTELRMSNPQRSSYVKFNLAGLTGAVTAAELQFTAPATSALGFDVSPVSDSTWDEMTITQNNAPAMGAVAASSGAFAAGPVSIDVTPLVTGNGSISFGLTRTSVNLITVMSRETGSATAPTLVVTTDGGGGGGGGGGGVTTTPFNTVADAFVSTGFPDSNFGGSNELRMSNPQRSSYVKFDVSGLVDPVTHAELQFSAPASSSLGFDVRPVADSTWGEMTITQNNAPPMGAVAASSGAFVAGPVTIDVTPLVTGNGTFSFGLTRSSVNLITVSSRETGLASAPALIVTTDGGGGGGGGGGDDVQAPSAPQNLQAVRSTDHVDLTWLGSIDDVGVTGYSIYRDGALLDTVGPGTLGYTDPTIAAGTSYVYQVDAFDAAGNHSERSDPAMAPATDTACDLCVLAPTGDHAVDLHGGTLVLGPDGVMWINSNGREALSVDGKARIAGGAIRVVGLAKIASDSSVVPAPVTRSEPTPDPLAGTAFPAITGTNRGSIVVQNGSRTVQPGVYGTLGATKGILVLSPGAYFVTQSLNLGEWGQIRGNGVTIYLSGNAGIHLAKHATANLSSPFQAGTGSSDMVVQFQKSDDAALKFDDVATATLRGQVYAPSSMLEIHDHVHFVNALVVVKTVKIADHGDVCLCE